MVGTLKIVDHINKLEVIVTYNSPSAMPEKGPGVLSKLKNRFFKAKKQVPNCSENGTSILSNSSFKRPSTTDAISI